jgi:hypothetical protein
VLGLAFWAIQGCLLAVMVGMTVRGEWKHQEQQRALHAPRPLEPRPPELRLPEPALSWELVGFTPGQRARLLELRASVRAAQLGRGALQDDLRAL